MSVLDILEELLDFEERHAEYERRENHEARAALTALAELLSAFSHARIVQYPHPDGGEKLNVILSPDLARLRSAFAKVVDEN